MANTSSVPYINDILHQPEALRDSLSGLAGANFDDLHGIAQELRSGKLQRVILTGMGSSYHVFHPIQLELIRQGIPFQMIETSELVHHAPALVTSDSLVIAVSQSGESAETLQLIRQMPVQTRMIGITNTAESSLSARSNAVLMTYAGVEDTVSCKTYVASLVALSVLANILTGQDPLAAIRDLQGLPDAVAVYLLNYEEKVAELEMSLKDVGFLILAGRGVSLAAVGTGALIIKESAHFPTDGMSCAAFRHGPLEMVSTKTFVLVYEGLNPTRTLNRNLVADILKSSGGAALVETSAGEGPFHLPAVPSAGLAVLEILPAQMMSLALAKLQGHIPGHFTLGSKVTNIE